MAAARQAEGLGSLIRRTRQDKRLKDGAPASQAWLGRQLSPPRSPQQISLYEQGRAFPDLNTLVDIYYVLRCYDTSSLPSSAELAYWLTVWLSARELRAPYAEPLFKEALNLLQSMTGSRPGPTTEHQLTSLSKFPSNDPLTIILADRRDLPAKSAADCLIGAGSSVDAINLPLLGAAIDRVRVRTDKTLVMMPHDYLAEMPEFSQSNLLIIGSPKVNWGSRLLNHSAIFPFAIGQNALTASEKLFENPRLQDPHFAAAVWENFRKGVASVPHGDGELQGAAASFAASLLGNRTPEDLIEETQPIGILDPINRVLQGDQANLHSSNDFAVATFAENPYAASPRYRAVICGGLHSVGTVAVVRELLANPSVFDEHPFGAVFEVTVNLSLDWWSRFEHSRIRPLTKAYTPADLIKSLRTRKFGHIRDGVDYGQRERGKCSETADFVKSLTANLSAAN